MGYDLFDELNTMAYPMVNEIIDFQLAGRIYLVLCHPDTPKLSHMLLIIDLLGSSNETDISGLMVHVTANTGDGHYPHFTSLKVDGWTFNRNLVSIITIGNLMECDYLRNPSCIPAYVIKYHTAAVYQQMIALHIPVGVRRNLVDMMANNVYYQMVAKNDNKERWTAALNCQQFARQFVTQALGLRWPDLEVAGDILPLIIDLGTMYMSSKENMKKKIKHRAQ